MTEPTDEAIGFTAYCDTSATYYVGDIIVFDSAESNIGGYYQTSSSQFICPVDGLYAFSLNILSLYGEFFSGNITRLSKDSVPHLAQLQSTLLTKR